MTPEEERTLKELAIDVRNLYTERVFSDVQGGMISELTPVNVDGLRDNNREMIYEGQARVMSNIGLLPIQGRIVGAKNLKDAIDLYPKAMMRALDEMAKRIENQGKIITPKMMPPPEVARKKIVM